MTKQGLSQRFAQDGFKLIQSDDYDTRDVSSALLASAFIVARRELGHENAINFLQTGLLTFAGTAGDDEARPPT